MVERLSLDVTKRCQLKCEPCYNDSGPRGDHGDMTLDDWKRVLREAHGAGIRKVQGIGGEITLFPHGREVIFYALSLGMEVEVFSNLVHVSSAWWELFQLPQVTVATSYYSSDPDAHNRVTGRASHARTRDNIIRAVQLGVPIRVGIVQHHEDQDVKAAAQELADLGVADIRVDQTRSLGRAASDHESSAADLCGNCGVGKASIDPFGNVSPCPMAAGFLRVGNVLTAPLGEILNGEEMSAARAEILAAPRNSDGCDPDTECSPGSPGSGCNPRN
ncbi:radical SAM/SPASM domain-containing protein [Actinomadura hibisca]|uniref:radical SAM/SPASM domain-containing protein n=1 Tax=Actinomadura hibisca TaxID=68565 RepID=UPI0008308901|nr:radical SAM protein [Actinomadura hibisca]